MNENALLFVSSVICLFVVAASFKVNKKAGKINGLIFFLYSLPLYYCFFYKNPGGSGFVWWLYLLVLNLIHVLGLSIYISTKLLSQKK